MNPLTGLRPIVSPGLQQLSFLPKTGAIPAAELQTLSNAPAVSPANAAGASSRPGAVGSFGDTLAGFVSDVNSKQVSAADSAQRLLAGNADASLHQTMINLEEARVAFQLMVEVRNKMLESYQEIMRMQI